MASYRWQRRQAKRDAVRRRIPKHGKNIAMVYRNAVLKHLKGVLVEQVGIREDYTVTEDLCVNGTCDMGGGCPDCGGMMVPDGSCSFCVSCGYSACG